MDQVGLLNGELVPNGFMEQECSSSTQHLTSEEEQEEVNALDELILKQM